ncbi:MAG: hypothetical protein ACTSRG_09990 [Candidatus Helarchaeota archaeon]
MLEPKLNKKVEKRVKLGVIANLFRILTEIYTEEKSLKRLDKIDGKEITVYFPPLNGTLLFKIFNRRLVTSVGDSDDAVSRITLDVPEDKIIDYIAGIVKSSDSLGGVLHVLKLYIQRKVKVKGSMFKALTLFRCLMCGNSPAYKGIKTYY